MKKYTVLIETIVSVEVEAEDADEARWNAVFDGDGRVVGVIDPDGEEIWYD